MNKKLITKFAVAISLIAVVGSTALVLNKNNVGTTLVSTSDRKANTKISLRDGSNNDNGHLVIYSEIPNEKYTNLDDAQKSLSYKIKLPSKIVSDESISKIQIYKEGESMKLSQELVIIFRDSKDKKIYTIGEGLRKDFDITKTKIISLSHNKEVYGDRELNLQRVTINGKDGIYSTCEDMNPGPEDCSIPTETENSKTMTSTGDSIRESIGRSGIYWIEGDISYSISEYGDLSKDQLVELGNSLQDYK